MRILAIGAHGDDIALGCGGSILAHKDRGDEITMLVVTNSEYTDNANKHSRLKEKAAEEEKKVAKLIGAELLFANFEALKLQADSNLIFKLVEVVKRINPDRVYTHSTCDVHLDHVAVALATFVAAKFTKQVLSYVPNFYLGEQQFVPNYYVDISDHLNNKISMLEIYKSEYPKMKKWIGLVKNKCLNDGSLMNTVAAESFKIVRFVESE